MDVLVDTDSWLRAAAGGGLIGLAAGLMIVANGRIAGISGVLGGLVRQQQTRGAVVEQHRLPGDQQPCGGARGAALGG